MSKSKGKDKKKGAQLVLRVEKAERDAFVALCERLDTSAAREIRRFMREMVAAHAEGPAGAEVVGTAAPPPEAADEAMNEAQPETAESKGRKEVAEAPIAAIPDESLALASPAQAEAPKRRKKPAA